LFTARWIQDAAFWGAVSAAIFSILAVALSVIRRRSLRVSRVGIEHGLLIVALLTGVAASIVECVTLCMRGLYVSIDLWHGYPWRVRLEYGFGGQGCATLLLIWIALGIAWIARRDARLLTCLAWNSAALALWTCLLIDPFRLTPLGGIERSEMTVLCMTFLAIVVAAAAFIAVRVSFHGSAEDGDGAAGIHDTSGFLLTITMLASSLIILIFYHLLVPVNLAHWGIRGPLIIATCAAALSARACFASARRFRHENLLDCAMMLASLAVAGIVMLAISPTRGPLSERYSVFFNALIIAFSLSCAIWARLAMHWNTATPGDPRAMDFHQLRFHAQRAAFCSAAMGLLSATLLCFWPRIRGIAAMDYSLDQVRSGVAANLLLLLVVLSCARRFHRWSFHILSALSLGAGIGFLFVRALPFRSHIG